MHRGCLLLVFLMGILVWLDADAAPRRRYRRGGASAARQRLAAAARAELQASENLLAAANSKGAQAGAEIQVALAKLGDAKQKLESAHNEIKELARHLNEIEQEILNGQAADSPYRQAKDKLEAARRELAALEFKLLKEGRYEERKSQAEEARDVFKLREAILSASSEYTIAKGLADDAAKELNRLRLELLHDDKDWKEISDALADAHRGEERAQDKANSAGVSRLGPLKDSRDAAQVAAYAQAHIAAAKSLLARLGVKPNSGSSKKNNSPGNKK
jgi:chromosome segregation ATPase